MSNQHDQDRDRIAEAYTPREGDVIERGRWRWVLVIDSREYDGHMRARRFVRSLITGTWRECGSDLATASYWSALVNHMGWRLLPRGDNAT